MLATVKIIKCRGKVGSESSERLINRSAKDDKAELLPCDVVEEILRRSVHKHGKRAMISEAKSGYLKRNSDEVRKKISISVARFLNQSNFCKGVIYPFLQDSRVTLWRGGRGVCGLKGIATRAKRLRAVPPLPHPSDKPDNGQAQQIGEKSARKTDKGAALRVCLAYLIR
ncbi:MAG: hypothetical protein K2O41_06195 [Clostridia bacterium]|nr:hypothetical protein [Clostridia bacterium]